MNKIIKIFGYGSLVDRRIQKILFNRELKMIPSKLYDWTAYICAEGYLGITKQVGSYVDGYILEMNESDVIISDYWEEIPKYKKEVLTITTNENHMNEDVFVYTRQINIPISELNKYTILESDYIIQEANLFMKKINL